MSGECFGLVWVLKGLVLPLQQCPPQRPQNQNKVQQEALVSLSLPCSRFHPHALNEVAHTHILVLYACVRCSLSLCVCFRAQTVKATLAKKELQETFLEFDLLGVVKRWLQVREACMHDTLVRFDTMLRRCMMLSFVIVDRVVYFFMIQTCLVVVELCGNSITAICDGKRVVIFRGEQDALV